MATFAVGKSHHFGSSNSLRNDFRVENLKEEEGKTELGKVPLNTEIARKVLLPLHSLRPSNNSLSCTLSKWPEERRPKGNLSWEMVCSIFSITNHYFFN